MKSVVFAGERNSADMLAWLASKQQNKVVKVDSIEQANDLLLSNKVSKPRNFIKYKDFIKKPGF